MKPTSLALAVALALALVLLRRRLNGIQLTAGAAVVGWLAVRGSGAVDLPDFEEAAKDVGPALGAWTYPVIGAMAFLETAFFLGLVAPGEFSVILGGFIAGQGEIDVFVLAAVVLVCAAAGDTTSFLLGRRLGRDFLLRHGRELGLTEERLAQVEAIFRVHGGKTIIAGRFIGFFRAFAPFLAGASKVPARRFLPIDYVAAAIWTATCVGLGYVFWQSFDTVVSVAKRGTFALGTLAAAAVLGVIAFRWLRDPANRNRLRRAVLTRSWDPFRERG